VTLLLGVDGGATKTVALVADETGAVRGAGRSGSSDIHNEVSPDVAVDHVIASVREALAAAGASLPEVEVGVFGLCGADWPEDVAFYSQALRARLPLQIEPVVTNDAFNTLRAGTADGLGVALVMGTGAAIAARGPTGRTWFSGERMERAGAMEFGRQVYDLLLRGEYGLGPRPGFEAEALKAFAADSVESMVYAITRTGGLGHRSLGRLAPVLLEASHTGDPQAHGIVLDAARSVSGYLHRAAQRVHLAPDNAVVVLAGGLFRHPGTDLRDAIAAALPRYRLQSTRLEPAYGALLMAADERGIRLDVERLEATGPAIAFFATEGAS
jgi:N-acetylglucosamine kinase-like BadF-type ATPase